MPNRQPMWLCYGIAGHQWVNQLIHWALVNIAGDFFLTFSNEFYQQQLSGRDIKGCPLVQSNMILPLDNLIFAGRLSIFKYQCARKLTLWQVKWWFGQPPEKVNAEPWIWPQFHCGLFLRVQLTSLVQVMACHLFGTKLPLPEPMMTQFTDVIWHL